MNKERETHTHPSYGLISFSRVNCGGDIKFFGSQLPIDNYIEMKVELGEMERSLTSDRFFPNYGNPNRIILKCRITPVQFSELITSLNMGGGVPCTIENIQGKTIPQETLHVENRKEFTQRSFKESLNDFVKFFKEKTTSIKSILSKQTLSKEDKREIGTSFEAVVIELENNLPFYLKQFQEGIDNIVLEAKTEVDAAIQHKITILGLNSLNELKQINNGS
jgi:hypothetical protein